MFEQAERDDPDYGVQYESNTPEHLTARAKRSIDLYRANLARPSFRQNDGHMPQKEALGVLRSTTRKSNELLRALTAYGAQATTKMAVKVILPFLEHADSSVRSTAAWALFAHRTEEVRVAMLARAIIEDVPLLKAYLEQLGEQP